MRALVVLCLALTACSRTEIDVEVQIDPAIDLARVHEIRVETVRQPSGDQEFMTTITLDRAAMRTERFVYGSTSSGGDLELIVTLLDGGDVVGCGNATVGVIAGAATHLSVPVGPTCTSAQPDLGTPDLAPPDLAVADIPPPGVSSCTNGGWLLCDGFDSPALDVNWLSADVPFSTDTEHVKRGARALHLHLDGYGGDAGPAYSERHIRRGFPLSSSAVFVRFFLYIPAASPVVDSFLVGLGDAPAETAIGADPQSVDLSPFGAFDYIFPPSNEAQVTIPTDAWTCLEWMVQPGAGVADAGPTPGGETRVWLNDVELIKLQSQMVSLPTPQTVDIFLDHLVAPGTPAIDVWIDDLAISDNLIGCAN